MRAELERRRFLIKIPALNYRRGLGISQVHGHFDSPCGGPAVVVINDDDFGHIQGVNIAVDCLQFMNGGQLMADNSCHQMADVYRFSELGFI